MIVTNDTIDIDKSSGLQESNFTIKATGKAFKILSDGLYSDKILAVIRELCCNAYDAHVAAKTPDLPFEIKLPNALEPHFSVKDRGIGLSHEDVMQLYTTYFASTKTDSNDFIGALGLGSKSPFSYIDKFSVISTFNGLKSSYTAYIGSNGAPSIAQMGDPLETDDHNGIEVTFPVKVNDIETFAIKAEKALQHFKVKPIVSGRELVFGKLSYMREEANWKIYSSSNPSIVIQGNVAYPLNIDSIKTELSPEELSAAALPLELEFPIGSLEPAASREGLSYETNTITNIKTRLREIYDVLVEECKDFFGDCPTEYAARLKFYKFFGTNFNSSGASKTSITAFYKRCVNSNLLKLKWKDTVIETNVMKFILKEYPNLDFDIKFSTGQRTFNSIFLMKHGAPDFGLINVTEDKTILYFDDLPKGGLGRMKSLSISSYHPVVFVRPSNTKKFTQALLDQAKKEFEKLCKDLDGAKFSFTSVIPAPIKEVVEKEKQIYTALQWSGYDYRQKFSSNCWRRINRPDPKVVKYYVPVYAYQVVTDLNFVGESSAYSKKIVNFDHFLTAIKANAQLFGLTNSQGELDRIYGLRKMELRVIEENKTNWVNLIDHIRTVLKDPAVLKSLKDNLSNYNDFQFLNENDRFVKRYVHNGKAVQLLRDDSEDFKKLIDRTTLTIHLKKQTSLNSNLLNGLKVLSRVYNLTLDNLQHDSLATLHKNILQKYPMIEIIEASNLTINDTHMEAISKYVSLIDNAAQPQQ